MTQITQEGTFAQPTTEIRKPNVKVRRRVVIVLVLLVVLLCLLTYMGVFGGNVHVVQAGRVYRSAQLTGVGIQSESARLAGHGLADVIAKDNIHTVINLRGKSDDANWYSAETAICQSHNVAHVDIPFSAVRMPPPESLNKLLATFDHTDYPVLYHCQAGADRTGLVSVLYAAIYEGQPLDQAENDQLTWRYAHIKWTKTGVMDDFFTLYRKTSDGMSLRDWIEKKYPALYETLPADVKKPASDMAAPANPQPTGP